MHSVWETAEMPKFDSLTHDISADVLVIGGGMAGILCAHKLAKAGAKVVVAEQRTLGGMTTRNTTAKITAQHGLCYHTMAQTLGADSAALYLRSQQEAVQAFTDLCREIDCDFSIQPSFVFSRTERTALEQEAQALHALGAEVRLHTSTVLPFSVAAALEMPQQAQFHPLKFLRHIAAPLTIYEHTPVISLQGNTAATPRGNIFAKHTIVATHYPMPKWRGAFFMKLYQHRSYAIALQNAQQVDGMYLETGEAGLSFRNTGDLLIVGGGDHRTGETGGNWQVLRRFAAKYYPNAKEVAAWATQDCMSLDHMPYIGRYRGADSHFIATGFNKWGMSSSMVAATLLTELLQGRKSPYETLYHPNRSVWHKELWSHLATSAKGLLTAAPHRCPHLGCALQWNSAEHTWDCACHGSRFTENGTVLENPAAKNICVETK